MVIVVFDVGRARQVSHGSCCARSQTRLPTHSASPASQIQPSTCARVSSFTRGANTSISARGRPVRRPRELEKIEVTNVNPLKINGVKVVLTDVLATNGVVHVIDDVLIPEGFVFPEPPSPSP